MKRVPTVSRSSGGCATQSRHPRILEYFYIPCVVLILCASGLAQLGGDVIGQHDLSPGSASPTQGTLSGSCIYCHAPHSGLSGTTQAALWDQKLSSVSNYATYSSSTMVNSTTQPVLGADSSLCLSCHDGTVALGQLTPYGSIRMSGQLQPQDILGTNLQSDHPFSFVLPLKTSADLLPSLSATPPVTADTTGHVRLINGNVECTSCHNPHVQNIDPNSNFLAIDNTNGALCLACHTTTPSGSGMGLSAAVTARAAMRAVSRTSAHEVNPLQEWRTSIHATASNTVSVNAESSRNQNRMLRQASTYKYPTVARNGCLSCHQSHNVLSPSSLLRGLGDQACVACHSGTKNVTPAAPNIFAEMAAPKISHSFPSSGTNSHESHEDALLDHNRHATCADCHNSHSSGRVATFAPGPALRVSQGRVIGISATDGVTVLTPAINQYENCLRCHGNSTGKQTKPMFGYTPTRAVAAVDSLNLIPQFALTSTSSHPVMHDRNSTLPQPSLMPSMIQLDGSTKGRGMGVRILCTDCHNSDDNREFGGTGANGPHGSTFIHILERRYELSQAPMPGKLVTNLFPNPNLSAAGGVSGGPYALCAKCHDLKQIVSNSSFSEHARHINDGFSCSVCHSAHGLGANSGLISGERLVNFDVNVVAPNGSNPISYSRARNSCSLTCHNHTHQSTSGTPPTRSIH
jgi:predicted CXXCH cytochrome family protein